MSIVKFLTSKNIRIKTNLLINVYFEYFVLSHILQDVSMESNGYNKVNPRVLDPNLSLFKTSSTLVSHGKSIKYLKCENFHKPLLLTQFQINSEI